MSAANESEILKILQPFKRKGLFPCGSRITCDPPVMSTDADWMVLFDESDMIGINVSLEREGFALGGSMCMDEKSLLIPNLFWSYTKDDLNLLITCSRDFYTKFQIATKTAKRLNLLDKQERIFLFQAILYGNTSYKG